MTSSSGGTILGAACNALLLWISIYVVTTHLLMWIRWDVVQPKPVVVEKMVEVEVPVVKRVTKRTTRPVDPALLQRHEELIEKLKRAQTQSEGTLDNELKNHQASLALIMHNLNHPSKVAETQPAAPKEEATSSLLAISSLLVELHQSKNPATIEASLEETLETLLGLAARNATLDWASVQDFLSHELPKHQKELMESATREDETTLVQPDESAECSAPLDLHGPPSGATIQDLNLKSKDFKLMLKRRTSDIQALLGTSDLLEKIQDYVDATEDEVMDDEEEGDEETISTDDETLPARVCIQPEDVKSMVRDALQLAKRNANPASLLVRRVRDLDPEETDLIMDAPLPPPKVKLPPSPDAGSLNMRHVLEQSPLTRDMIQLVVDGFLDVTSGHIDWLDQWVDGILETSDGASVGQVFVKSLMDAAGYVQIPIPNELETATAETKAGILSTS